MKVLPYAPLQRIVWVAKLTLDYEVRGSNSVKGGIQLMTFHCFIVQSLSLSCPCMVKKNKTKQKTTTTKKKKNT